MASFALASNSVMCYHRYGALNVQAGTLFCDADFQKEVKRPFADWSPKPAECPGVPKKRPKYQ